VNTAEENGFLKENINYIRRNKMFWTLGIEALFILGCGIYWSFENED
jgi:hypothetical protein